MTPEIAAKRIQSFRDRFGQPHLYLAYHAAFPLALTPDLLYRLWGNFQRDAQNQVCNIPWIAVSDLLLSSLCEEVGHHLYEMEPAIRSQLLQAASADRQVGEARLAKLSDFLATYARQQLQSSDPQIQEFAQAQYWTALLHAQPSEALQKLALTLQDLGLDAADPDQLDAAEVVRMTSLLETLADSSVDDNLRPLLTYARAMASYVRGDTAGAAAELATIATAGKIEITGIDLPIPRALRDQFRELKPTQGVDYRGKRLRGRSFKGKDLTGANFSGCDLRGVNFTNATLVGADFSEAKTGLQKRWATGLVLLTFVLLIFTSLTVLSLGGLAGFGVFLTLETPAKFERNLWFAAGLVGPILLLAAYGINFWRGVSFKWGAGGIAYLGNVYFTAGIVFAIAFSNQPINNAPNIVTLAISGLAIFTSSTLFWLFTRRRRWSKQVSLGMGIILVLLLGLIAAIAQGNVSLFIALSLIAVGINLTIPWVCSYIQTFRQTLLAVFVVGVITALITDTTLIINNVLNLSEFPIILLITIGVFLAGSIILSPPLILGGVWSHIWAILSTLFITTVLILFFLFLWIFSQFFPNNSTFSGALFILLSSILAIVLAWSLSISVAVATALAWAESERRWMALVWSSAIVATPIVVTLYLLLNLTYWLRALLPSDQINNGIIAGVCGASLVFIVVGSGLYMGWQATVDVNQLKSSTQAKKFQAIRQFAIAFAAKGGTHFRGADLSDANFTLATLKGAHFKRANLTRTQWSQVKKIDRAEVAGSYLQSPQIQQLVTTNQGQNQNFDRLNLQGINLRGANLTDASFIGSNLKEANLRGANLSGAKLLNTQLDQADLTGALLTGAFLQNVQITSTTKLRNVECDYIYTHTPTPEHPDLGRIPKNERRKFKPGELTRFLKKTA